MRDIWNRSLSVNEIESLYKRGVVKLNLSVRSCNDNACAGESFSEKLDKPTNTNLNITITPNNRYFQYIAKYYTENSNYTADFFNVTVYHNDAPPLQFLTILLAPTGAIKLGPNGVIKI